MQIFIYRTYIDGEFRGYISKGLVKEESTPLRRNSCNALHIQLTPFNRVTLVPEHFDPIKRNLGVVPINQSELILFLWFCSWPSNPIKRSRLYLL